MSQQVASNAGTASSSLANKILPDSNFTIVGIITFSIILWVTSQNAKGQIRQLINGFLGVLLLSMILLNWKAIGPIFFNKVNGG